MNINHLDKFRNTLASGKTAIGAVVTLSDMAVSECAGDCGLDFVWIDSEHAPHSLDTIKGHVILKPILDLAPAGVIIPMVNSAEEAEAAVAACRYPPRGIRGCGVRRAIRYGSDDLFEYLKLSDSEPLVIVQIEHINAVRNLDEILKVPGLDSICVGPCDLSGSMGILCQTGDAELNKVIDEICRKTKAAGKLLGTASGPLSRWQKRGIDWIATGGDWGFMAEGFRNMLKERDGQ